MDWDFGDIILTMVAFFFWFTFVWMFIGAFADIIRRADLSGWAKAGWIALVTILPLLGVLAYMISRPVPTTEAQATGYTTGTGSTRADEISKLVVLHDKGELTDEEFNRLKSGALA
jgi:NADH:ubiquinone oxidoreductase subunit 6 (subunit J)